MITIKDAVKRYGSSIALNKANMTIGEGRIVGLLGVNGAGKSTALKAIAGLVHLDSGEVLIDGKRPTIETRSSIAYLPEIDVLYPWMRVADAITYMRDFYEDWDDKKMVYLLDYFKLKPSMKLSELSKGMRAKAKLVMALSRRAKYLLLDEPLSGIDVLSREDLLQGLVEDFAEEGQTILITTHEVKEVESILDDVLFIRNGTVVLEGQLEQLKTMRKKSLIELMKEVYVDEAV